MRIIFLIITLITFGLITMGQSPQKISYQAIVRNSSNLLVVSTTVGMRITILQGSASGTPVYIESHSTTTNANGLVSIQIGDGLVSSGSIASINWSNGPYFIKTETDPTGGTAYSITGTSQILSVPYSIYSESSGDAARLKTLIYSGF